MTWLHGHQCQQDAHTSGRSCPMFSSVHHTKGATKLLHLNLLLWAILCNRSTLSQRPYLEVADTRRDHPLKRFGLFAQRCRNHCERTCFGSVPTTPDPNTSAKNANGRCMSYSCVVYILIPDKRGDIFEKASRYKWEVYRNTFKSIGVRGRGDSPECWQKHKGNAVLKAAESVLQNCPYPETRVQCSRPRVSCPPFKGTCT